MGSKKVAEVMDFYKRVVRYLFWLLVVSWSAWLLKKALAWMVRKAMGPGAAANGGYGGGYSQRNGVSGMRTAAGAGEASQAELAPRKLVRDPVCGVYLAEVLAIPLRDDGELVHFCSTACRDRYAVQVRRRAANG
jgi:hypothetical protein